MTNTLQNVAQKVAFLTAYVAWHPRNGYAISFTFEDENSKMIHACEGIESAKAYGKLTPDRCRCLALTEANIRAHRGNFESRYQAHQDVKLLESLDLSDAALNVVRFNCFE